MNEDNRDYWFIEDSEKISALVGVMSELTDGEYLVSREFLSRKNWIAAPIPAPLSDSDAGSISDAINSIGCHKGYAISTQSVSIEDESGGYRFAAYEIIFSKRAIFEFGMRWTLTPFCLFPPDVRFVLLNEGDYHCIVAGDKGFVESAIGKSVESLKREFTFNRDAYSDELIEVFDYYFGSA